MAFQLFLAIGSRVLDVETSLPHSIAFTVCKCSVENALKFIGILNYPNSGIVLAKENKLKTMPAIVMTKHSKSKVKRENSGTGVTYYDSVLKVSPEKDYFYNRK